jgi:hypothetical protein
MSRIGDDKVATPKELETENAALRKQLSDEHELTEQAMKDWQATTDALRADLAEAQKKAACPPAESPISMNWTMYDKRGAQVQITMRAGIDAEIVKRVFNARAEFVEQVLKDERGWTMQRTAAPNAEAPTPPTHAAQIAAEAGASPQAVAEVQAARADNGRGVADCAMIEVGTSYKGGKTQLKFYVDGFEHPLTYTREVGDMVKLLTPLGFAAAHIVVGKKYAVKARVTWEQNDKYKNVVSVQAS